MPLLPVFGGPAGRRPGRRHRLALALLLMQSAGAVPPGSAPPQPQAQAPEASEAPPAGSAGSVTTLPISDEAVLALVTRSVDWYHRLSALELLPEAAEDVVTRDRLNTEVVTALQLGFVFGHACAARHSAPAQAGPEASGAARPAPGDQLSQAASSVATRITGLEGEAAGLDQRLQQARGRERAVLVDQRENVRAGLDVLRAVQASLAEVQRYASGPAGEREGDADKLGTQLAELEQSVPAARKSATRSAASAPPGTAPGSSAIGPAPAGAPGAASVAGPAAAHAASIRPESAGIITLTSEWLGLQSTRDQLTAALRDTESLETDLRRTQAELGTTVRSVVAAAVAAGNTTDTQQLLAQRQSLEADEGRFQRLATVLVPLAQQGLTLDAVRVTLQEWRNVLATRSASVSRYLALRLGLLVVSLAVVLGISQVWRRATFRYLHDARRRRQFLLLRRIVIGVALTVVILFSLVSEVGSVATYIGFVTAGLAVALQNVILAVVAYFFLISRQGVRVGDRVTLAGVTGRVADIGLLRTTLIELSGDDQHPTGRLVVLSNAVLFQPSALYREPPGARWTWHTLTLQLESGADLATVQQRLRHAAEEGYAKFRAPVDQQHAGLRDLLDFESAAPEPEVRVQLTAAGLECVIRYPVSPPDSGEADQQMIQALQAELARAPALALRGQGALTLGV